MIFYSTYETYVQIIYTFIPPSLPSMYTFYAVSINSSFGFVREPTNVTVVIEMEAIFHCQHTEADVIGWTLNGISLLDLSLDGVSAHTASVAGGVHNTLTIVAHPQYNNTQIKCVALHFDGSPIMVTDYVIMSIQGE